jgi:hypothetical protein
MYSQRYCGYVGSDMNSIKMPKVSYGKCMECQVAAEYYFSEFGSNEPCINCDASPINIIKVQLVEVGA